MKPEDRQALLYSFKSAVFAKSSVDFQVAISELRSSPTAKRYPQYIAYVDKLVARAEDWAICYRANLMIRSNNTNNFAEAGVRVQKDAIFERARAYNPAQLFDMLSSRLDSYYSRRLQDIANGIWKTWGLHPFPSLFSSQEGLYSI